MDYGVGNIHVFLLPAKTIIPKVRLSATSESWGFLSSFLEEILISFFLMNFFFLLLKIITSKPFGNCKVLWSPPQLHTEVASSLKNDKCLWFSQYWETAHFWPEVSIFFRCTRVMEYLWQCSKLGHPSSLIFWMWQERVKSFLLSALQTPDLVCSLFFYPFLPWLIHLMSSTLNLEELADKSIRGQWGTVPGQTRSLSYDILAVLCAI